MLNVWGHRVIGPLMPYIKIAYAYAQYDTFFINSFFKFIIFKFLIKKTEARPPSAKVLTLEL